MAKCLQNRTLIQTYNSNKKKSEVTKKNKITDINESKHPLLSATYRTQTPMIYIHILRICIQFSLCVSKTRFFKYKNIKTDQTWKNELPLFTYPSRT